MSAIALAAKGLAKRFGSLAAVDGVSFELPQGARYALVGPNGAGKTTLVNLLTGMERPDAGRVFLAGREITHLAPELRVKRGLARTFQLNTLFPELTPIEAVTLAVAERRGLAGAWYRKLTSCHGAIEEAYQVLASLNLLADCGRPSRELAYGRQRLLEIALARAAKPKVLLLDEPANGVPTAESAELFTAVAALPRDIAILFIERDLRMVSRIASRIVVLAGGRILAEGAPAEIAANPQVREAYLGGMRVDA